MIHHIPEERLIFLFLEGLIEPLRDMTTVTYPKTLDDAIGVAYDLEAVTKSMKGGPVNKGPPNRWTWEGPSKVKTPPAPRPE